MSTEHGWLAVNLRIEPEGFFFTEGFVSFVRVFDASGETLVGRVRSRDPRVFLRRQLAPGTYRVETSLRPCDGSCQALDPPRDRCTFSVQMSADGANRLVVVRVKLGDYAAGRKCTVSDQGDVIDRDTKGTVTDLTSFTQALVDAGLEARVRLGGWRWLRPFFVIPDQVVKIDQQQLHVFDYATRAKLRQVSISPDGTGISSKDGVAAIIEWTPRFYRSGRLLVLYLGDRPIVLETLNLLLGPPFAGR